MGERSTIDAKMTSHVFCTNLLIISDFSTMKECKSSLFKLKLFCEIKIFLVIFFIHKNFIFFTLAPLKIFPNSVTLCVCMYIYIYIYSQLEIHVYPFALSRMCPILKRFR